MEYIDVFDTFLGSFFIIFLVSIIMQIAVIFTIAKSIIAIIKSFKRKTTHNYFKNNVILNSAINKNKEQYIDISKKELATFNTDDLNAFKDYFYKIFLDFENAYNNLDYNTMKSLSTKQLFQNYYTGITLDLETGKKKIISNIQKKKVIIFETFSSTAKQVISAMIEISYINYTIDKKGYILSGNKDNKITEKFEVVFRKDFGNEEITNCPNCGAAINGHICEFCRSTIRNSEFKISSIKKIIDK